MFVSMCILLGTLTPDIALAKGVLNYQEELHEGDGSVCSGQPNKLYPWMGAPDLLTQVENGSLYLAGYGDDQIYGKFNSTVYCLVKFVQVSLT